MTKTSVVVALAALASVVSLNSASADIRVFRAGQEPSVVSTPSNFFDNSFGFTLQTGAPVAQVVSAIRENALVFGAANFDENSLKVTKSDLSDDGLSLRFQQVYKGLPVDGAEVVALFDSNDQLEVLNTSLDDVHGVATDAELSLREAVEAAAKGLSIASPEVAPGEAGELRIAKDGAAFALVWQFAIRNTDGDLAHRVQVVAAGARKGEVLKTISLKNEAVHITIYDSSVTIVMPNPIYKGVKVLEDGQKTLIGKRVNTREAENADGSIRKTLDYYMTVFKRNSYDNNGASMVAAVNANRILPQLDVMGMHQNAAWVGPWKMFVFGSGGDMLGSFTESLDVVGHEFTHAVISSTSDLAYESQSGALNEHFADVFGATIENYWEHPANPFLIGDKCLRGSLAKKAAALRDMLDPHKSLGGQPAKMSEIPAADGPGCKPSNDNDNCGVHNSSGIPNRAAALIIQGFGWDNAAPLFYRVMTARLRSTSDFADYRNQMMDECKSRGRLNCEVIRAAFADVGL